MYCCRQSDCSRTATATTRPSLVPRTARHVDVDAYSTTLSMPEPPSTALAYSLYHLISQYRTHRYNNEPSNKNCDSIPLVGVYDALSAKIFAQNGAPALFLSGFGVSASLLGAPDAGMLNLVEMEMVARNVCSLLRSQECRTLLVKGELHPSPLIVDGDTGYGDASNMLRTISALASAGAAAITIEDQQFPKKCTIAAGSRVQIVDRDEAVQRVRCALGARNLYNTNSPNSNNLGAGP
jgi:isocitrate lyase